MKWFDRAYDGHATSMLVDRGRSIAVASADVVEWADDRELVWWVARVFVNTSHWRKGFGSEAVRRLVAVAQGSQPLVMVVSPGGYGTSEDVLTRFYEHSGFFQVEPGLFRREVG